METYKRLSSQAVTIQRAQLAMNEVPAFNGNVKTIRTDALVDRAAEELHPTWEKNREQWNRTGGDGGIAGRRMNR